MGLEPMALCLGNIPPSTQWLQYKGVERKASSYGAFILGDGGKRFATARYPSSSSAPAGGSATTSSNGSVGGASQAMTRPGA